MRLIVLDMTKLKVHTTPSNEEWFTINHDNEFYYSGVLVDGVATFDDWTLFDVLEDCPRAVDVLEYNGFTVTRL